MLTYSSESGWTGADSRTLYLVTDTRTGDAKVRPGYLLTGFGPAVEIRIATGPEALDMWHDNLKGWTVAP